MSSCLRELINSSVAIPVIQSSILNPGRRSPRPERFLHCATGRAKTARREKPGRFGRNDSEREGGSKERSLDCDRNYKRRAKRGPSTAVGMTEWEKAKDKTERSLDYARDDRRGSGGMTT